MTTSTPPSDDGHLLVHQFIRAFGRRPQPDELAVYPPTPARLRRKLWRRARRRAAERGTQN